MIILMYFLVFSFFGLTVSHDIGKRVFASILMGAYGVVISISRLDISTGDLPIYVNAFSEFNWSNYYMREPVLWLYGKSLWLIIPEPAMGFLVLDSTLLLLIRKSFNTKDGLAIIFFVMTFPFVLGFTNIYRQLFASVLLIKGFSDEIDTNKKFNIYLLLSMLTHISVIPLISFYYFVKYVRCKPVVVSTLGFLSLILILYFNIVPKVLDMIGGTPTRSNTSMIYVTLFYCLALVTMLSARRVNMRVINLYVSLLVFSLWGLFILISAPASSGTRIYMICILVMCYLFLKTQHSEGVLGRYKFMVSVIFLSSIIFPSLLSPSAWHLVWGYTL